MTPRSDVAWPHRPYLGLDYFRPKDRPLLTGRDIDVLECTTLLAHPRTRVLLLHGSTGCGKSSFLRAGLIPEMEEQSAGHLFLKVPGSDDEALFIRCTDAPIDQIARQVFVFASNPFQVMTPSGERTLDLSSALLSKSAWEAYLNAVRRDTALLLDSLGRIAAIIPQTLVLIVDQAEEVLTFNPGEENFSNRTRFFQFLRELQEIEFDARIIVALRTEFFGRFIDAIQVGYGPAAEFRHFLLQELSRAALIEAVCRPTVRHEVSPFGSPYAVYGFAFESRLPERIVDDILAVRYSGPALPILQLVCLELYESAKANGSSLIAHAAYTGEGEIQGLIISHIRSAVSSAYASSTTFETDIHCIRRFLTSFYTIQDDGTVVARSRSYEWATNELGNVGLSIPPRALLECLTSPRTMVLRTLRAVDQHGNITEQVTLGHDSIAFAIERWGAQEEAALRARQIENDKNAEIEEITRVIGDQKTKYDALSRIMAAHEFRFDHFIAFSSTIHSATRLLQRIIHAQMDPMLRAIDEIVTVSRFSRETPDVKAHLDQRKSEFLEAWKQYGSAYDNVYGASLDTLRQLLANTPAFFSGIERPTCASASSVIAKCGQLAGDLDNGLGQYVDHHKRSYAFVDGKVTNILSTSGPRSTLAGMLRTMSDSGKKIMINSVALNHNLLKLATQLHAEGL